MMMRGWTLIFANIYQQEQQSQTGNEVRIPISGLNGCSGHLCGTYSEHPALSEAKTTTSKSRNPSSAQNNTAEVFKSFAVIESSLILIIPAKQLSKEYVHFIL
jgi:hypothetical protein